jgi:ThiS family
MGVKVIIPYPHLRESADGRESLLIDGRTVGECLKNLVTRFPRLETQIFKQEELLDFVTLLLNGKSLHGEPDPLLLPVVEGDELTIVLLLAGG